MRRAIQRAIAMFPKMVRLSVFIVSVWGTGIGIAVHVANAEVENMMLGLGAELMQFPGADEDVREMNLNGAQVYLRVDTVDGGMSDVLDHYEDLCRGRDAGLGELLSEAIKHPAARAKLDANMIPTKFVDGVLRASTDTKGVVACLDMGEDDLDLESFAERARRAVQTGNVTDIGHLRYAFAQPIKGQDGRTMLITMWTERPINIFDMIPTDGNDVSGEDPEDIPRPARTQRILSSWETGKPYGANIYRAASSPAKLERFYRDSLPALGWRFVERRAGETLDINGKRVLAVEQDERIITLLLGPDDKNGAYVTLLSTDSL